MKDFIKTASAKNGTYSFHFSRIYSVKGVKYFMSVRLTPQTTLYFIMEHHLDKWYIIFTPETPDWLKQYEDQLSEIINEHKL